METDGEVEMGSRTGQDGRGDCGASTGVLGVVLMTGVLSCVRARRRAARRDRDLRAALAAERAASRRLVARLQAEAHTDPLTGLANLRQWREQLERELDRARRSSTRVAVAVIDLDRFKDVNDARGHAAGDALLREVSHRFVAAVRTVDLVARVGGEEFAVALPDVSSDDAAIIVERLRTSVPDDQTASAGLALWDGAESAEQLQRRADQALYRAKATGRDRLVVA